MGDLLVTTCLWLMCDGLVVCTLRYNKTEKPSYRTWTQLGYHRDHFKSTTVLIDG